MTELRPDACRCRDWGFSTVPTDPPSGCLRAPAESHHPKGRRTELGRRVREGDALGEGTTPAVPSRKSPQQLRKNRIFAYTFFLVILLLGLAVLGGPWAITSYDKGHHVSIECNVTGAEGGRSSASARGSASWSQVRVSTSDCGSLVLSSGINQSNRHAVAAELAMGGKYSFQIGAATQSLRWLTDTIGMTPVVWEFQKID